MKENNNVKMVTKFLAVAALFFYTLCWFIHQPSELIWYVGVGLPWISLLIGLPLSFAFNKELSWTYCYIAATLFYVIFVSVKTFSLYTQIPYFAACTTFIASVYYERLQNKYEEENKKATILKEKCNTQSYHIKSLQAEQTEVKKRLSDIVSEQSKYDDYTDEVIVLARSRVLSKFCRELLKNISEYQKMDKELYS